MSKVSLLVVRRSPAIFATVLLVSTSAFAALGASRPETPKLTEATEESVSPLSGFGSPMSDSGLNEAGFMTSESDPASRQRSRTHGSSKLCFSTVQCSTN
jgi:hypothetical protein